MKPMPSCRSCAQLRLGMSRSARRSRAARGRIRHAARAPPCRWRAGHVPRAPRAPPAASSSSAAPRRRPALRIDAVAIAAVRRGTRRALQRCEFRGARELAEPRRAPVPPATRRRSRSPIRRRRGSAAAEGRRRRAATGCRCGTGRGYRRRTSRCRRTGPASNGSRPPRLDLGGVANAAARAAPPRMRDGTRRCAGG